MQSVVKWSQGLKLHGISIGTSHRRNFVYPTTRPCCVASSKPHQITNLDQTCSDSLPTFNQSANVPLVEALKTAATEQVACFHFPGHNRGKAAPTSLSSLIGSGPFNHDLPELPELDDLFSPQGPILEAQSLASELFGAHNTWFLVNGSTCGVHAAIMATCNPGDILILPRNSHLSATSGMVLTGAIPKYIMPDYNPHWDVAGGVSVLEVQRAIQEVERDGSKVGAVLVTTPTYHGICTNLEDIVKICHSLGIPVIADEAHGAHFRFNKAFPRSALEQGADLSVQSTHKVLSSLTQSSMLHLSGNLVDPERVSRCLQLLQSSSPSYLLLSSLDAARAQLSDNKGMFDQSLGLALEARKRIQEIPGIDLLDLSVFRLNFCDIDPLRITVGTSRLGLSGHVADDILYECYKIVPELVGTCSLTFAFNLGTRILDVERLILGLNHLSDNFFHKNSKILCSESDGSIQPFERSQMVSTPRDAFFAKKRRVRIKDSIGEICGELICTYPPGIPLLIPGEVITEDALTYLLNAQKQGALVSGASDTALSSVIVCDQ
ncbi:Purple acid phosphatase [Rhynchospora pubera]|uniref:Purple acid phosphatase n=1 Tax=Rhynchospora pubera TaxID=906938 RepID=A0AAV8FAK1_9POAL|nr:Purple acid phosphatase [Rhynchospora pubera]